MTRATLLAAVLLAFATSGAAAGDPGCEGLKGSRLERCEKLMASDAVSEALKRSIRETSRRLAELRRLEALQKERSRLNQERQRREEPGI